MRTLWAAFLVVATVRIAIKIAVSLAAAGGF